MSLRDGRAGLRMVGKKLFFKTFPPWPCIIFSHGPTGVEMIGTGSYAIKFVFSGISPHIHREFTWSRRWISREGSPNSEPGWKSIQRARPARLNPQLSTLQLMAFAVLYMICWINLFASGVMLQTTGSHTGNNLPRAACRYKDRHIGNAYTGQYNGGMFEMGRIWMPTMGYLRVRYI